MRGTFFYLSIISLCSGVALRTYVEVPHMQIVETVAISVLIILCCACSKFTQGWKFGVIVLIFLTGVVRMSYAETQFPQVFKESLNTYVSFDGVVAADPDSRETSQRVKVHIEKDFESITVLAVVPLYEHVQFGDQVKVSGLLVPPEPFATDGGRTFRYDQFLAKDHIQALVQQSSIKVTGPPQGALTLTERWLYQVKSEVVMLLERALPEPYASLAVGILAGGKQGLGPTLLAAFTVAGMLQIVVLSGYNVMIVAEIVIKVLSRLPKVVACMCAGICIIAFVIASGASSSAIRAAIMALIALLGRSLDRTYAVLRALCVSLGIMVLINPLVLMYDPGLQLSFLATLGLILGVPVIEPYLLWIKNAFLRDAFATTIAAQLAVLPLLLYESGNLSLVALPANIAVMPVVPVAMMLSAIAALIAGVVPLLAPIAGLPAYACLWYIIWVATVSAKLPFAQIIIPAFSVWWMVAAYVILALAVYVHIKSTRRRERLRVPLEPKRYSIQSRLEIASRPHPS